MSRKTNLLYAAAFLAATMMASCTKDLQESSGGPETDPVSSKLIFTSQHAIKGELLVYFEEDAVESLQTLTKSGIATRSGISSVDAILSDIGVKSLQRLFPVDPRHEERTRAAGLHRWYLIEFNEDVDLDKAARDMARVSEISKVEFSQKLTQIDGGRKAVPCESVATKASTYPDFNDPRLAEQWHYINTADKSIYSGIKEGADVNCRDAWRICTGDPRVIVAVVDNCVQWDHPDLAANMWTNEAEAGNADGVDNDGNGYVDDTHGFNFVDNTKLTISTKGDAADHGTHVAGTVAAVNNNGTGVCGVAGGSGNGDGVKIMSCQIFCNGNGGTSAISAKAIKYAADNGASIIQCSYGYPAGAVTSDEVYASGASAEKQAIDYFISTKNCDAVDGGIVIYAAGNDMTGMSAYPGAYKDYISVTAMSCDYTPAYYTNYGPGCNIAAPGGDLYQSLLETDFRSEASGVLSTINGGKYGYMQGTSMACPHVSGVAALGLSYALKMGKSFTRDQFNTLLLTSVNGINDYCTGSKKYVNDYGQLATLNLSNHSGKMGTGYIDAFQVLMNVRGVTCIPVTAGKQNTVNILEYIGDGDASVKISGVDISSEDMSRLGMASAPTVFGNNIIFKCNNSGSAIIRVKLQAGTSSGSGINSMSVEKEFAILSRVSHSSNGGWL